jgi:hypothetical protein
MTVPNLWPEVRANWIAASYTSRSSVTVVRMSVL